MVPSFFLTLIYFLFVWKCKVRCMSTPSDMSSETLACEKDWYPFENYCYKMESRRIAWVMASHFCKDLGGDLVSIHSKEEMDFITESFLPSTSYRVWIGLHDSANETTYEWSDGSAIHYVNWKPGEPSGSAFGEEDCVEMLNDHGKELRHGKWNDASCTDRNPFICKISNGHSETSPTRMTVESPVCDDRWVPIENYCYYLEMRNKLSWSEASDFCIKSGGHLASIHSKQENDIFTEIFLSFSISSFTWIGLHDQGNEGNFEWSDGSTVDYENWNEGEPSGSKHGDEDCAGMVQRYGKWNDATCSSRHAYICEKLRIATTPVTELAYQSGEISDGSGIITIPLTKSPHQSRETSDGSGIITTPLTKILHQSRIGTIETSHESGNAAVITITIVVICVVLLMIAVAGFIYLKRKPLAEKEQTLFGAIFKSSSYRKIDKNSSKDKIKLLEK